MRDQLVPYSPPGPSLGGTSSGMIFFRLFFPGRSISGILSSSYTFASVVFEGSLISLITYSPYLFHIVCTNTVWICIKGWKSKTAALFCQRIKLQEILTLILIHSDKFCEIYVYIIHGLFTAESVWFIICIVVFPAFYTIKYMHHWYHPLTV